MTPRQRIWAVTTVLFARLRFVAIFVIAALVFGYWDNLRAHIDKRLRPDHQYAHAAEGEEWYCPMHPQVKRSVPGQCPICNMDLVKRDPKDKAGAVANRVQLSPERMALANVGTTPIAYRPLVRTVRALGVLDYDETKLANISARVAGRADELFLTYTGQSVKAGEPVYSLYSPEVFTAQREYLQARDRVQKLPADAAPAPRADASAVYNATMQKLVLWGISREQLDKLDKEFDATGKVPTHFTVTSPIGGIVVRKDVTPGQYLQVGQTAYAVADLSTLWLRAKVYEADIPLVKIGQKVDVVVDALPTEKYSATVTFLAFALDPQTRTLDARIEVPNPGLRLKPGMFATAVIQAPAAASKPEGQAERSTSDVQPPKSDGGVDAAAVFQKALGPYLKSADLLAHDKAEGVSDLLGQTVKLLEPISGEEKLKDASARLAAAVKETAGEDIGELRKTFRKVSVALIDVAKVTGQPVEAPGVQIFRCPMRDKPYWLQVTGPTANPYYGSQMFDCGGPVEPLPRATPPAPAPGTGTDHGAAWALAVPRSAVIDTGTRKIVYVQTATSVFDLREVQTGPVSADDYYPVLGGLKEGDQVVTKGAFLVDSENRLNPATPPSTGSPATPGTESKPASAGHVH